MGVKDHRLSSCLLLHYPGPEALRFKALAVKEGSKLARGGSWYA